MNRHAIAPIEVKKLFCLVCGYVKKPHPIKRHTKIVEAQCKKSFEAAFRDPFMVEFGKWLDSGPQYKKYRDIKNARKILNSKFRHLKEKRVKTHE